MLQSLIVSLVLVQFAPAHAHSPPFLDPPERGHCQTLLTWAAFDRSAGRFKREISNLVTRVKHASPVWMSWLENRADGFRYQGLAQVGERIRLPQIMPGNSYRIGVWNRPPLALPMAADLLGHRGVIAVQNYRLEPYSAFTVLVTTVIDLPRAIDLIHLLNFYAAATLAPDAEFLQLRAFITSRHKDFKVIEQLKQFATDDRDILEALQWPSLQFLEQEFQRPLKLITITGLRPINGKWTPVQQGVERWEIRLFYDLLGQRPPRA